MPTREELHGLVDSLPEKSLEAAERFLTALQTWPPQRPPMPPDIERFRTEYKQRRNETITASKQNAHWEADTYVAETHLHHQGHPLRVIERLRIDGDRLLYKHSVTGPGNKSDEREIIFDLTTSNSET